MRLLLGIDVGTTGVKVLVIDEAGGVVASGVEEYPLEMPLPGWAEQAPDSWWEATVKAIRRVLDSGVEASDIEAVGLSGQMHGLVPLGADDRPLRPAILWCDQRPVEECDWLDRHLGDSLLEVACNPPLAGFTAPKLLWMKNSESSLYKKMKLFLLPKDYIRLQLSGEKFTDISDASGTLMVDVERGEWAAELISDMGLRTDILPAIVESERMCGWITKEAAAATGLKAGTPVAAGGADNTCAAVGTGIVHPGRVSSSIGSSGVVFAHTDELLKDHDSRLHSFNHSVPGKFYLMGVMLSAGLSFRWFRDTFGYIEKLSEADTGEDAYDMLITFAEKAPPCCEGLLFLPYLQGERTPHKDPHARGVYCGISLRHGKEHMVRALMEGVIFGLKDSFDIVEELGIKVDEVRSTGGGGKSLFWRQMQADVFGKRVVRVNHDEGPAYGAALLAGVGAGVYPDVAAAADATVKIISVVKPRPDLTAVYAKAHERYRELYRALRDSFRSFAAE